MPIISLLGLSLAMHILGYYATHYFTTDNVNITLIPPYQPSSHFSVALESSKQSTDKIKFNKQVTAIPSHKKIIFEKNKTNRNKKSSHNNSKITSANNSQTNKALLIRRLKSKINQNFNYPSIAQRKGWQGIVLLEFNISHAGFISDIKIKNSSGYAILDHAAQKSLSYVQRVKLAVNMNLPINTRLQIPIIYQLTNG